MKTIKELIKIFSEHIKELSTAFLEPAEQERSFEEIAVIANVGETNLQILKKTMGGVAWNFTDEGKKESKAVENKNDQEKQENKSVEINNNVQKETQKPNIDKTLTSQKDYENERG